MSSGDTTYHLKRVRGGAQARSEVASQGAPARPAHLDPGGLPWEAATARVQWAGALTVGSLMAQPGRKGSPGPGSIGGPVPVPGRIPGPGSGTELMAAAAALRARPGRRVSTATPRALSAHAQGPSRLSLRACAMSTAARAVAVVTGRALRARTAPPRVREVPPPQRGEKKTWKALLLFYWRFFPLTAPSQPPHIKTSWPPKRVVASGLLLFGEFSLPCSVPRVRSSCEGTNPYLE